MQFWKTITGTHVSFLIDGKSLSSKRTLHFTFTCFTYSRSLSAYDNRLPNFWKTSFRGHTWRAQKLFEPNGRETFHAIQEGLCRARRRRVLTI